MKIDAFDVKLRSKETCQLDQRGSFEGCREKEGV